MVKRDGQTLHALSRRRHPNQSQSECHESGAVLRSHAVSRLETETSEKAKALTPKLIMSLAETYIAASTMADHIENVRSKLDGAVKSYNSFVGSLEASVTPQARNSMKRKGSGHPFGSLRLWNSRFGHCCREGT